MQFGTTTFMDFFIFKLHLESCKILVNTLLNEMPEILKPGQNHFTIISLKDCIYGTIVKFGHISEDMFKTKILTSIENVLVTFRVKFRTKLTPNERI